MGAACVGALVFLFAGILGEVPNVVRVTALVVAAVGAIAVAPLKWQNWLPQHRALIPQAVALQPGWVAPARFGFEMGTGLRTFLPTAAPHYLLLLLLLSNPGLSAMAAAASGFGLARTSQLWFAIPCGGGATLREVGKGFHKRAFLAVTVCSVLGAAFAVGHV